MSERLRLDASYMPLYQDEHYSQMLQRIRYHTLLNNTYTSHFGTTFIQNKNNVKYIVNQHIIPLFNKYDLNRVRTTYSLIDSSSKEEVIKSNNYVEINFLLSKYNKTTNNKRYYIQYQYQYPSKTRELINTDYNDIPWAETWHGTRRALRYLKTPQSMLVEYCRWCGFDGYPFTKLLDLSIQVVLPWFDKLKQYLHQRIDFLPTEIRYFFDMPTMAGFPKMENRLMTDDPVKWLSEATQSNVDEYWWADQFMTTFGQATVKAPTNLFTLYEFAVRPWLWTTNGATGFSKLYLDGEVVRTKFGAAVSLTSPELIKLVEDAISNPMLAAAKISVFIKPDEKGYKRRLIANVPLGAYIIASYVRYLITSFTSETPLFMKLSPSISDIVNVVELLRNREQCYPLDESAYDYNVTREAWQGFFIFMRRAFPLNRGAHYLEKYFNMAIWEHEGNQGKWIAGMPSGLALTSFLNSWMNYIKQRAIVPGYINWAAGDDVLAFPIEKESLDVVSKKYKQFGAVANPIKNWTSDKFGEYLKRLIGPNGTSGYPARIWASLMYAGNERFFLPSDKLPELAELWKQFFDRLGINMPEHYVGSDLSRAISNKVPNFTREVAIQWLHAPRVHGGFGKLPYNKLTFTWTVPNVIEHNYVGSNIRLPRHLTYHGNPVLTIGKYRLSNSSYRLGPSYRLRPIETYEDWEKRLNREDIEYHGPFQSIILDVIPLPCVDFISTAFMSQFAADQQFNSFPNLSGSWNSIASRLINASIGLVNAISYYCNSHNLITLA